MSERDMREIYISWLQRSASRSNSDEKLCEYAWEVARKAAKMLRERYGVSRIRVFGSLAHEGNFYPDSDIDLAVEGLKPVDYWEALTSVLFLDKKIPVEIVDLSTCSSQIRDVVEREGIEV
jgi:uncharacterized protein